MNDVVTIDTGFSQLAIDILREGHSLRFRAHGSSMRPFILDGDILTIDPARPDQLKVGDVIFYLGPETNLTAHRLHAVRKIDEKLVFLTRGDGNAGKLEQVKGESVLGRASGITREDREWTITGKAHITLALLWGKLQPMGVILYRIGRTVKNHFKPG